MYTGPIIDVDLHHRWRSEADVVSYLAPKWREMMERERNSMLVEAAVALFPHSTGTNKRTDAAPADGSPGASHYPTTCEQWVDAFNVERAVLTFDVGTTAGVRNPYLASALSSAANDWSIDRWIEAHEDPRLGTAAIVPTQIIEDGVRELERMAAHPRVVEALVVSNGLDRPFGHPAYHPIYATAEECGLPVAIHNGGDQWMFNTTMTAGGLPPSRFEYHTLAGQSVVHHIVSFITHGVFEKYPRLKLMAIEIGIAWLPWLLWSLDSHYDALRKESPWVKRLPSEYIRDHVLVSTQPMEESPRRGQMIDLLESAGGLEDILVFASDYPHWDTDDPRAISNRLPKEWWPKVFYENAAQVLRWPDEPAADSMPLAGAFGS
jgi:predicted TIM-barrel fold metal-dependent hydrolase